MTRRQRIADLTTFAIPGQPALSPDGVEVVYVLTTVDSGAAGGAAQPELAALAGGYGAPVAWAPDGSGLIGHTRLFRVSLAGDGTADPDHDRGSKAATATAAAANSRPYPDSPPTNSGPSRDRGSSTANIAAYDPRSLPEPVEGHAMTPVGPDLWLVRKPGTQTWAPVTCYALPTGEKYLHFGARATPKA